MKRFIEGECRAQSTLLPERLDEPCLLSRLAAVPHLRQHDVENVRSSHAAKKEVAYPRHLLSKDFDQHFHCPQSLHCL